MNKFRLVLILATVLLLSQNLFSQGSPTHKFLLGGYGFTNLEMEQNQNAQFEVGFNPIFLWSINNNILFESELEFELEDGGTSTALEYAQIMYIMNKYITFGAGKFLNPTNIFAERFHPAWINKLPGMPLGLSGHTGVQLVAGTQVGLQVRGGVSAGPTKFVYAVYVSNGPSLNIDESDTTGLGKQGAGNNSITNEGEEGGGHSGIAASGTLNYGNIPDNNGDKAIGGRIGFLPIPELEIGYGFETARVGTDDTQYSDVRSFTNVFDLSYVKDYSSLAGRIDIRGQYTWLQVDNPGIGVLNYENISSAWYVQLAYQPYYLESSFLQNLEFVVRYDQLDLPEGAELNVDKNRIAGGVNYWINHSTVVKFAYESTTSEFTDESETESAFVFQLAMGF